MCRYVVIGLLVFLVVLMAVAAVVVQEYGWTGFLVVIAGLGVLGWLAKKALPRLFAHLLMRPMRRMGAALHGARITVHAVRPCEAPPRDEFDPDEYADDAEPRRAISDRADDDDEEFAGDEDDPPPNPLGPLDWYQIEFTVTPRDAGPSEGRIANRRAWTPGLIGAVGPRPPLASANPFRGWPPADQFPGYVHHDQVEVWDGEAYQPEVESVFGEQRVRMRVGVTRDLAALTITYAHFTEIGQVSLPRLNVPPEESP